jgi:hypothetical protein
VLLAVFNRPLRWRAATLSLAGAVLAGGIELLLPVGIAVCLATLASLNLAGNEVGRITSWVLQPIMLIVGGLVTAGQVFAVRYVTSAFMASDDPTVRGIDVKAFVDAAPDAFPAWLRYLVAARFVLATAGSLLIIVLLATPSANAYLH